MGPGQNPFGFDLSELMRLLQSPGPVNMEVARRTAEAMAGVDPETGDPRPEPSTTTGDRSALEGAIGAVRLPVAETTGITAALTLPARITDRRDWATTTVAGLEPVLGALAGALGRPPTAEPGEPTPTPDALFGALLQGLVPLLLGGWAGSMIGNLAHRTLGRYDLPLPLTGEPEIGLVAANVAAFATEWDLPADEVRYAVALRETTRAAIRSTAWVRDHLVALASAFVGAYEVGAGAIEEQFRNLDLGDPEAMASLEAFADPEQLLGAMRSPRQEPLLADLRRFTAILEGYADLVAEHIGSAVMTTHARTDEAVKRHRVDRGDAGRFVDRLLGLELRRDDYEAGIAFCRGVVERGDGSFDDLNRLWESVRLAPTAAELGAPGLWLARIELPD